jgi:FixJ family two-component response regulator
VALQNNQQRQLVLHPDIPLPARQYAVSVVVHDPGTLQTIALMLSSWGYLTELYASAEEFLSAVAISEAACVVIDIDLGDLSGVDLAIRLAAMGLKLPIIFVTESQDEQHRQRAMDFGCAAFLIKPFPADRLSEAIRIALGLKLH